MLIGCTFAEGTLSVIANFTATDSDGEKSLILSLILLIPLLVTNMLATSIVGYRTWFADLSISRLNNRCARAYRKEIKIYLQEDEKNNIVEKVLVIFLESGALYCVWWVSLCLFRLTGCSYSDNQHLCKFLLRPYPLSDDRWTPSICCCMLGFFYNPYR